MGYADLTLRSLALARRALICAAALAFLGTAVAPAHAQTETFKVGTFTKPAGVVHEISASNVTNSAQTLSITGLVPGTSANRLLVVGLSSSNTLTGVTVTFAGNTLTAVPSSLATNTVRNPVLLPGQPAERVWHRHGGVDDQPRAGHGRDRVQQR